METKEYKGEILRLKYPSFLRIKAGEPDWYAASSRPFAHALVMVDPPNLHVDDLERRILNPHFKNSANPFAANIVREGEFHTAVGLVGYERVVRSQQGGTGTEASWDWLVGVKWEGHHVVQATISAVESAWDNGKVWGCFLDSIEIVSSDQVEVLRQKRIDAGQAKGRRKVARARASIESRPHAIGILAQLPSNLTYLIKPALMVGSFSASELEDNQAIVEMIEESVRNEMRGLARAAAVMRIRADREQLWEWLQQHPAEKYPETLGLYGVCGALQYADGLADRV